VEFRSSPVLTSTPGPNERIHSGLVRMLLAAHPSEAREGQFVLRAALAPFPEDRLQGCWNVARDLEPYGKLEERVERALAEVQPLMDDARRQLDDLLAPI